EPIAPARDAAITRSGPDTNSIGAAISGTRKRAVTESGKRATSATFPDGVAFLGERAQAFLQILRLHHRARRLLLLLPTVGVVPPLGGRAIRDLLRGLHGDRRVARDDPRELERAVERLADRHDFVDEAVLVHFGGGLRFAG